MQYQNCCGQVDSAKHLDEQTLVIGAYLDQLDELGAEPALRVTRSTRTSAPFDAFRRGVRSLRSWCPRYNFSIDCRKPPAAVQVGNIHARRGATAGRILRICVDWGGAIFYRWWPAMFDARVRRTPARVFSWSRATVCHP